MTADRGRAFARRARRTRAARAAAAALALGALAGCGTSELFGTYDLPESPEVANAPWPRLADTRIPPPPGTFGPGYPDPAEGVAVVSDLSGVADRSAERASALGQPVISEQGLRRLGR
ncbi:hypothetical protein M1105_16200 [Limibaculum sp. FT325]|uniref:hypothetical protein n=1 Tax=Thermohalobaculum sediminis TaxID=2939436 RepID=UPI0020BE50DC|nr:hypothetical protein [Limibaculum sediminis]MCL5778522.1 hypothetical protein [Limibaculum sediminis]